MGPTPSGQAPAPPVPAPAPADPPLRRIGVLGGTFDPIHNAHLFSARVAAAGGALDRVLLVPANRSPLKGQATGSPGDRVAMARLAAAGDPLLAVSTVDVDRPPPSYMVDTLRLLGASHPGASLSLILGIDALQDFLEWRHPERILDLAGLIVVSRPGFDLRPPPALVERLGPLAGRIRLQPMPRLEISSTDIRRRVGAGEPVRYLLPEAVEGYIRSRGLYHPASGGAGAGGILPASRIAESHARAMVESLPETEAAAADPLDESEGEPERPLIPPQPATPPGQPEPLAIAKDVVQLASDKGAADILLMDIRKLSIIADYFIICTGDNERQIRAISRGIQDGVDERFGLDPLHRVGPEQEQAGWVLLDYGGVIVHVFSPQMREFYRLERLWNEAATLLRMQ